MDKRPSLSNGYLWVCGMSMPTSRARLLERQLGDGKIRCDLRTRDVSNTRDTVVRLYVHPEDEGRACELLERVMDDP